MDWNKLTQEERVQAERAANLLSKSKRTSYYTFEDAQVVLYLDSIKEVKEVVRNVSFKCGFSVEWLFNDNGTEFDFGIRRTK